MLDPASVVDDAGCGRAETCCTTVSCARQCMNFAGDPPANSPAGFCGDVFMNITSRSASGNEMGRNSTALTTEKMAV